MCSPANTREPLQSMLQNQSMSHLLVLTHKPEPHTKAVSSAAPCPTPISTPKHRQAPKQKNKPPRNQSPRDSDPNDRALN